MSAPASGNDDVKRFIEATKSGATTVREAMLERLIQIAFTDEVVVIGKDSDGELLKRVSSRESLDAIKTAYVYDQGKPPPSDAELRLKTAEHLRSVAHTAAELAIKVLGTRLYSMSPEELGRFLREASGNPAAFLEAAMAQIAAMHGEVVEAQVDGERQTAEIGNGASLGQPERCVGSEEPEVRPQIVCQPPEPATDETYDGWPKP